jgi:large subunit ribosomal protein L4
MRAGALFSVLSKKLQDGEVLFLDQLSFSEPKTKEAKAILNRLGTIEGYTGLNRRRHAALIAVARRDKAIEKSFQNFGNIRLDETRTLNPTELLRYKYVIIADPESSIETLLARGT